MTPSILYSKESTCCDGTETSQRQVDHARRRARDTSGEGVSGAGGVSGGEWGREGEVE